MLYLFLSGCASTPQSDALLESVPSEFARPTELTHVAFYAQREYQCGPAALATVLHEHRIPVSLDDLVTRVYIPERQGSLQIEMVRTIRDYNLVPYQLEPSLQDLLAEINAGRPVLVLQNLGVSWYPRWHYAVVVGYDLGEEKIILRSGEIERYVMDLKTFEHTWRRSRHWSVIALSTQQLPANPNPWRYLKAITPFEETKNWTVLNQAYQTGLAHWPNHRDLLFGYATARYLQSDRKAAQELFARTVEKYPDYAPARNNYAQVLLEEGNLDAALLHARRAIELGGEHSEQYRATLNSIRQAMEQNHLRK